MGTTAMFLKASTPTDILQTAVVGLSFRKISTTVGDYCIKVRRSSDDTTLQIGWAGNYINVAQLQDFCAGTDGFVEIWYGQGGTTNFQQTDTTKQPKIVSSGTIIKKNGFVAMESVVTPIHSILESVTNPFGNSSTRTEHIIFANTTATSTEWHDPFNAHNTTTGVYGYYRGTAGFYAVTYAGAVANASTITQNTNLRYFYFTTNWFVNPTAKPAQLKLDTTGTAFSTTNNSANTPSSATPARIAERGYLLMVELIVFNTYQTAGTTSVQTNQKDFYGVT